MPERETLEVDVLIVGAGPAGLGAAIRLADLAKKEGRELEILVIEKAREVGAHGISGAVMVPRALRELIPDFEAQGAPIEFEVYEDFVYHLLENECIILPITPPPLRNEGNLIISLAQMVRWLAKQAEARGVMVYPEFPGSELLIERALRGAAVVDQVGFGFGPVEAVFEFLESYENAAGVELADFALRPLSLDSVDVALDQNPLAFTCGAQFIFDLNDVRLVLVDQHFEFVEFLLDYLGLTLEAPFLHQSFAGEGISSFVDGERGAIVPVIRPSIRIEHVAFHLFLRRHGAGARGLDFDKRVLHLANHVLHELFRILRFVQSRIDVRVHDVSYPCENTHGHNLLVVILLGHAPRVATFL